jgi:hypothetical protein
MARVKETLLDQAVRAAEKQLSRDEDVGALRGSQFPRIAGL